MHFSEAGSGLSDLSEVATYLSYTGASRVLAILSVPCRVSNSSDACFARLCELSPAAGTILSLHVECSDVRAYCIAMCVSLTRRLHAYYSR